MESVHSSISVQLKSTSMVNPEGQVGLQFDRSSSPSLQAPVTEIKVESNEILEFVHLNLDKFLPGVHGVCALEWV